MITPACCCCSLSSGSLETHDPRFVGTVKAIERELLRDKRVVRGRLRAAGQEQMFDDALRYRTATACWRRASIPVTGELLGNFPQTYSMAGLILTAMRLSRSLEDRFWRG